MNKATYKRKYLTGDLLAVSEGEPMTTMTGKHEIGALAEHLNLKLEVGLG